MDAAFLACSAEETIQLGEELGKTLPPNTILSFFGDLGAGKTTFIQGVVAGVTKRRETVMSPTFVYLNIYEGIKTVYHFDLYRLQHPQEFLSMGFDDFLDRGGISCIEWSERISSLLPDECTQVVMTHRSENKRHIAIHRNHGRNRI